MTTPTPKQKAKEWIRSALLNPKGDMEYLRFNYETCFLAGYEQGEHDTLQRSLQSLCFNIIKSESIPIDEIHFRGDNGKLLAVMKNVKE